MDVYKCTLMCHSICIVVKEQLATAGYLLPPVVSRDQTQDSDLVARAFAGRAILLAQH